MIKFFQRNVQKVLLLHRYTKRIIIVATDIFLCIISLWIALKLSFEDNLLLKNFDFRFALISSFISIPIFWFFGLYRTILRFSDTFIFYISFKAISLYGPIFFLIVVFLNFDGIHRSVGITQPLILFFGVISSRLLARYILSSNISGKKTIQKKNVIVYGAGDAGRQLVIALENSLEFKVVCYVDDNILLHGRSLLGKQIHSPKQLEKLIHLKNINIVLLALPAINRSVRNKIINDLNKYRIIVKTLPTISEVVDGRITLSDIKDLNIDDLLNREEVKPNPKLLKKNIESKIVLVTGAGGSIGSELCRQIIRLNPNKLLLVELNEYSLYKTFNEISNLNEYLNIIPLLSNTQDELKIEKIIDTFKVNTIYHAAAYKHVPLVEENICEGLKNNIFSTVAVTNAAVKKNVSNLVLISSDKAVRPTNIMGASKRLSELYIQGIYEHYKNKSSTQFSIVRFGNVLESSGSVIPKFKKQIKEGGPVTLTHNDITRYFMTLTEASQLVIQAGAMGKNAEVFVLDMGDSIKIRELVLKMISLSGLSVKNDKNPDGDIEIIITGLRPGEKLYEELLIGDDPKKTIHPKIQKINENFIPYDQLNIYLQNLKKLIEINDVNQIKHLLIKIISNFNSNSKIVDHLHLELLSQKNNH